MPKKKRKPPTKLPQVVPSTPSGYPHAVRFIDRKANQCGYPAWDTLGPDIRQKFVCGAPIAVEPYCIDCARLCYPLVANSCAA